jgi:uncharacterized protein DUF6916
LPAPAHALKRGGASPDGDRALVSTNDSLPKLTRRRLLATGGATAAAATVALSPRLAAAASAVVVDPAHLRRSSYAGRLGQRFAVDSWGSTQTLTLIGVSDIGAGDLAGHDEAFSLAFTGDPALALGDAPTPLRDRQLGRFALFVARVDPAGEAHFEAVVNRSVGVNRRQAPSPSTGAKQPPPVHEARRVVQHVSARRTARGVRLEIVLDEHSRAKRAHGWLMKGERLLGVFDTTVHEHRVIAKLPLDRRLPRRSYDLVVGAGGQGAKLERTRIKLR